MTLNRAVVQNYDMPNEMQEDAVRMAIDAVQRYSVPKDIAAHLKREFDRKYEPAWHCVVGREFGSCVMHESERFIYFYLDGKAFMLYRCGQ
ncbi:Dynein light chain [Clonorchis sinensis]|uniref:Dynein light chain n=1 Tax=Clonorchis sinensis TaxID=79923 RepID=A0A419QC24_CLOSI|nr:Dynein light chain [Clonorchis sinensis]